MSSGSDLDPNAQFLTEVFPAELEEISRRRREVGAAPPGTEPGPPAVERGLVGLALSGGGIRSATYCLGVLQALAGRSRLKLVDYLSTVSGGGFIGACLSSTLSAPDARPEGNAFPLRSEPGREEPPAVVHLRNSGNYLAPGGALDKLRLAAVLIRGIVVNLMLLLPAIMVAVAVTELAHELVPGELDFRFGPLAAIGAFLLLVVSYPLVARLLSRWLTWKGRNLYEKLIAFWLLLATGLLVLVPVLLLIDAAVELSWEELREEVLYEAQHAFEADDLLHWLVPIALIAALLAASGASKAASRLRDRLVLYLVGLLGPIAILAIYFTLCVFQIDSPVVYSRTLATLALQRLPPCNNPADPGNELRVALQSAGVPLEEARFTCDSSRGWWLIDESNPRVPAAPDDRYESRAPVPYDNQAKLDGLLFSPPHVLALREDRGESHVRVLHDYEAELNLKLTSDGLRHEFEYRGITLGSKVEVTVMAAGPGEPDRWQIEDPPRWFTIERAGSRLAFVGLEPDLWDQGHDELFVGLGIGLLLFNLLFVNVNQTSSHGFYRDRLSRSYLLAGRKHLFGLALEAAAELDLGRVPGGLAAELSKRDLALGAGATLNTVEPGERWRLADGERCYSLIREGQRLEVFRALEPADKLRLSELSGEGTAAPYHLINVALNLQGSSDPSLRGRNADFFFFSKRFTGGRRTGYCRTVELERLDSHLDVATAMAVSGAAANPNMGTTTLKSLVFILTLLNIRLGYWLPSPRWVRSGSALQRLAMRLGVGPRHLLREALGQLDDRGGFVNLSDGGHLENLGVYELLRRRCRLIVAVDAEADPGHAFPGLVNLIRLARIDLGIEIQIDLAGLRRDERGRAATHWAAGRILYGGREAAKAGTLVYLKASVSGDEADDVLDYQARNPDFPHESTARQFFAETQFEAYRALGYHAADGLCAALAEAGEAEPELMAARRVLDSMAPRES